MGAGRAVSVEILHFLNLDGDRFGPLPLAIALVVLIERELCARDGGAVVAGSDELFEAELVEVGGEVLEEIALEGVVAVAVHDLAAEGVRVELEVGLDLFLDVDILGVELVLFGRLRGAQISIHRLAFRFRRRGRQTAGPSEPFACVFPRCRLRHGLSVFHQGSPN